VSTTHLIKPEVEKMDANRESFLKFIEFQINIPDWYFESDVYESALVDADRLSPTDEIYKKTIIGFLNKLSHSQQMQNEIFNDVSKLRILNSLKIKKYSRYQIEQIIKNPNLLLSLEPELK
jgi:hypothetical protein